MKTGIIYMYTSPSGKRYIGQTWNEQRRKQEHRAANGKTVAFHAAIKKYGKDAFVYEILHCNIATQEDINRLESLEIKRLNTLHPNGYNLTSGGEGGVHNEISKQKLREAFAKNRDERVKKMQDAARKPERLMQLRQNAINNASNPKIQQKKSQKLKQAFASDEVRRERSEKRKLEWADPEIRARRIAAIKQSQSTDEYKKSLSKQTAKRWENPIYREKMKNLNVGRKRPQEAIEAARLKRMVKVQCIETREIFESVTSAAKHYGIFHGNISNVLSGKQKTAAGKTWKKV